MTGCGRKVSEEMNTWRTPSYVSVVCKYPSRCQRSSNSWSSSPSLPLYWWYSVEWQWKKRYLLSLVHTILIFFSWWWLGDLPIGLYRFWCGLCRRYLGRPSSISFRMIEFYAVILLISKIRGCYKITEKCHYTVVWSLISARCSCFYRWFWLFKHLPLFGLQCFLCGNSLLEARYLNCLTALSSWPTTLNYLKTLSPYLHILNT